MLLSIRLLITLSILSCVNVFAEEQQNPKQTNLNVLDVRWIHGAESCATDTNPPIQVFRASPSSYILRLNKCTNFEAPFIYLLLGKSQGLLLDTGAIEASSVSPIYETVNALVEGYQKETATKISKVTVAHSHSHRDHTRGDPQFAGKPHYRVIGTSSDALQEQLQLKNWPEEATDIDLGDRVLSIIPIPGHQEQSIAIYDHETKWLLTGDTLYPGVIRVKNWHDFRASIARLAQFAKRHPVDLILGAHIEMDVVKKKPYRIGSTYQPNEPSLALRGKHLQLLNDKLQQTHRAKKLRFDEFTVAPLSWFEKFLSDTLN